jgi:hypothetical protein
MNQLDIFDHGVTFPHAPGSHTSWKAARQVNVSDRATKTRRYLALLAEHGTLTDPETAALTSWPRSSICSIRFAVEQALLVTKSGEVRPSPYKRDCAAYQLTESGRAAHHAYRGTP